MIVLDVETSGLDPKRHGIISIGGLDLNDPDNIREFSGECRLHDDVEIDPHALEINGFDEMTIRHPSRTPSEKGLLKELALWIRSARDKTPAGLHVAAFDIPVLAAAHERNSIEWQVPKRTIDLHALAQAAMRRYGFEIPLDEDGNSALKTDDIHVFTGIGPEPRPHVALQGAQYESESLWRLIYGRNLLTRFVDLPVPEYLT